MQPAQENAGAAAGMAMDIGPLVRATDAAGGCFFASAQAADRSAADVPTQEGPKGLRYDFNDGCRVVMPESDHPWRVRLSDLDTGNILFETELKAGRINSTKRYFVRFRIEVWQNGESLFVHDYSAAGRDVLIQFPVETLGDPIGWFPYAVKFQAASRVPAHLRHERQDHPVVARCLSRHRLHPLRGRLSRAASTPPTSSRSIS